jgi:hypothetical protein
MHPLPAAEVFAIPALSCPEDGKLAAMQAEMWKSKNVAESACAPHVWLDRVQCE